MTRRYDAGPLLALLGSVLLLISLFLAWYEPSTEAWDAFEIVDLIVLLIAIGGVLAALAAMRRLPGWIRPRWLPALAAAALVLVVKSLVDPPPVVDAGPGTGLWLALSGAALMGAGALLSVADVRVAVDVAPRRDPDPTAPTQRMPPRDPAT